MQTKVCAGWTIAAVFLITGNGFAAEVKTDVFPVAAKPEIKSKATATFSGPVLTTSTTGTVEAQPEEKKPEVITPLFVRPFVKVEPNRNDSNPQWSRSGMFLSFERSRGDKKEINIALADGTVFQTIYYQLSEDSKEMKFFFPGVVEEVSYNSGITWSPREDRFVFMSNGGEGNYDLYLCELGGKTTTRLTDHKEKDGQADWSPKAESLVFVSGRTGNGDLYQMDLATRVLTRLTRGGKAYLYPVWSPDGRKIAMMHGSNENHDIRVINDVTKPTETLKPLTTWDYDDLRPAWSPDGKKIAFYSNYNQEGDPRVWSIVVIASDGSDPTGGDGLSEKVVAVDVIPDMDRGPAWMPDSNGIVYVKNDRQDYNPIYLTNIKDKTIYQIKTDTKMNHDVACSADGTIAFRAQVNQWDQIFLARIKN